MPPKSKAQAKFMRAAAAGDVPNAGISKKAAKEFVADYPTKGLPNKVKPKSK